MIEANKKGVPEWQLHLEFATTDLSVFSECLADVAKEFSLRPGQLTGITEVLAKAVDRIGRNLTKEAPSAEVRLRIWASAEWVAGSGCGLFMVEKQAKESRSGQDETIQVVDLFLYQVRPPSIGRLVDTEE